MVLGALLLGTVGAVHAQWKWRDADGRITVSDLPPPRGIPDRDILSRPDPAEATRRTAAPAPAASAPAVAAPGAAPAPPVDRDLEARKRAAEAEQQARQKAEEEQQAMARAENCRRARSHMAALESGQRIARFNAKGEREILDDRGRAAEMQQARQVIASDCR